MSLHPKTTPQTEVVHASSASGRDGAHTKRGCRAWLRSLVVKFGLIGLLVVLLGSIGFYVSQPRYYNILVIGSDQRTTEHARSDGLLIAAIPKSKRDPLSLVTIPRDTKIEHAAKGLQKITHFYAMWDDTTDRLGNRALTEQVVEDLLDIHIHGTVEVTFDSFSDIVDLLGGVDLPQGHLAGEAAQELVHNRFVQPAGDFGRTDAQRDIFKNLLPKLYTPANAQTVYQYFLTSDRARLQLSRTSVVAFGITYLIGHRGHLSPGELTEVVLPGVGTRLYTPDFGKSLYYWELDAAQTDELVDQYLQ